MGMGGGRREVVQRYPRRVPTPVPCADPNSGRVLKRLVGTNRHRRMKISMARILRKINRYMVVWEKGPIGNVSRHENKFDCRESTLSNATNHLKIFPIEFEICLYKHLYFLHIMNPLFPIVVFISMF